VSFHDNGRLSVILTKTLASLSENVHNCMYKIAIFVLALNLLENDRWLDSPCLTTKENGYQNA
jgi:hypothetical protein